MTMGSLVTSAAGSAAILLRRRPADSRPAACRIIRGGDLGERGCFYHIQPDNLPAVGPAISTHILAVAAKNITVAP
jgi:hypothetical protein